MRNPFWAQVVALAAAIAHAEGFWMPGARPRRSNNPGDLVADGAVNGVFYTRLEGFDALAWKVSNILAGASHVYPLTMTWRQLADVWTGGDHAGSWCDAVCDDLNLNPETTLQEWRQSALALAQDQVTAAPDLAPPSPHS